MSTAATSFPERNAAEVADLVLSPGQAKPEVVARRMRQRRQMYAGMPVTISEGMAVLRDNDNADTFLARADSALYSAKAQGRNRIAIS